jgi:spermidine synthase
LIELKILTMAALCAVVALIAGLPNEDDHPGQVTGYAYAANTCGAIVAAVGTGFFLVPWLGSFRVVAVAAAVNLVLGMALEWCSVPHRNVALVVHVVLTVCIIGVGWSSLFYDRALASFSTVLYWNYHHAPLTLEEAANTEDIVFLSDGLDATISVSLRDSYLALKTDGKVDASTTDTITQLLLGDLGTIFHPRPRRVLVIGFGSGMTASAVSRFPRSRAHRLHRDRTSCASGRSLPGTVEPRAFCAILAYT